MCFHPLDTDVPKPAKFNDPFDYLPHPLCLMAAAEVLGHIEGDRRIKADAGRGKMFGVLVVETEEGRTGFLAAYSGLLDGSNDHPFFVPPVFDATRPDGYFKRHEAEITAINRRIASIEGSEGRLAAISELDRCMAECKREEDAFRSAAMQAKALRNEKRSRPEGITPEEEERMTKESQFMKAELRRIKKRNEAAVAAKRAAVEVFDDETDRLKQLRRQLSDNLQQWLFSRYDMLDANGTRRNLCSIFADTPQRIPPAGAGDCCAPKLLQHAYLCRMRPVCMAEFWYGASPKGEIRRHLNYYPACRGKCLPILRHMLQGLDVETAAQGDAGAIMPEIVYEDSRLCVVNKPAGLMSVPGKTGTPSLTGIIKAMRPGAKAVLPVHRLDMDTSGLLVVAFDMPAYKHLQRQFAGRGVSKRYVAVLDGITDRPAEGTINLPIRPDPLDRPYQKVDYAAGKPAVTRYRIISTDAGRTRIALYPQTGRTHQLRVHCAHADGLGIPIVGDRLYGTPAGRLMLHAESISFVHPESGRVMSFCREAEF